MAHTARVRPALLVVPDFHGRAPLAAAPAFCDKLRALERDGHEIYLHGYYHRAHAQVDGRDDVSPVMRLRRAYAQRVVSRGEAEFSDVTYDEAVARLDDGERTLRDVGLTI